MLFGSPGSGKTMLARRMAGILPPLVRDEALAITAIYSVAGLLSSETGLIGMRPFRAPHYTASAAGLGGGGDPVRPGEVSLAHHGVLFLDELLEFRSIALETLRTPLADGHAIVYRAKTRTTFPARPLVIAAMSPCSCGYAGSRSRQCTCSPEQKQRYLDKLGGALFNHFDVRVVLPPVDVQRLQMSAPRESSREVQKRVIAARTLQAERLDQGATAATNAQLSAQDLERFCNAGLYRSPSPRAGDGASGPAALGQRSLAPRRSHHRRSRRQRERPRAACCGGGSCHTAPRLMAPGAAER